MAFFSRLKKASKSVVYALLISLGSAANTIFSMWLLMHDTAETVGTHIGNAVVDIIKVFKFW